MGRRPYEDTGAFGDELEHNHEEGYKYAQDGVLEGKESDKFEHLATFGRACRVSNKSISLTPRLECGGKPSLSGSSTSVGPWPLDFRRVCGSSLRPRKLTSPGDQAYLILPTQERHNHLKKSDDQDSFVKSPENGKGFRPFFVLDQNVTEHRVDAVKRDDIDNNDDLLLEQRVVVVIRVFFAEPDHDAGGHQGEHAG